MPEFQQVGLGRPNLPPSVGEVQDGPSQQRPWAATSRMVPSPARRWSIATRSPRALQSGRRMAKGRSRRASEGEGGDDGDDGPESRGGSQRATTLARLESPDRATKVSRAFRRPTDRPCGPKTGEPSGRLNRSTAWSHRHARGSSNPSGPKRSSHSDTGRDFGTPSSSRSRDGEPGELSDIPRPDCSSVLIHGCLGFAMRPSARRHLHSREMNSTPAGRCGAGLSA